MSSQPLLVGSQVGCCEYNCLEEFQRPSASDYMNDHFYGGGIWDSDQYAGKLLCQTIALFSGGLSVGLTHTFQCKGGTEGTKVLAYGSLGMTCLGILVLCSYISDTSYEIQQRYTATEDVPTRKRCVNDFAVIYSICCLAFSIFACVYANKDC